MKYLASNLKAILIFIVLSFSFNFNSFSQGRNFENQRSDSTEKLIIATLKKFYTDYITQCDNLNNDSLFLTREKYCTTNLLYRIYIKPDSDILDYDPFLQAQDCDKKTIPTLRIWKDTANQNLYFISYIWPYSQEKKIIRAIIKREGTFKIDSLPDIYSRF